MRALPTEIKLRNYTKARDTFRSSQRARAKTNRSYTTSKTLKLLMTCSVVNPHFLPPSPAKTVTTAHFIKCFKFILELFKF